MFSKKTVYLMTMMAVAAMLLTPLIAAETCGQKACEKTAMHKGCSHEGKTATADCCKESCMSTLNAEQKEKIGKMHGDMQKLMAEQKPAMEKLHQEMNDLMKKGDQKLMEAKIDEISKIQADMHKKMLTLRLAVRALLSDEQKAKCDAQGCCMMSGHGGHPAKTHCSMEKTAKPSAPAAPAKTAVACGDDCSRCDKTHNKK